MWHTVCLNFIKKGVLGLKQLDEPFLFPSFHNVTITKNKNLPKTIQKTFKNSASCFTFQTSRTKVSNFSPSFSYNNEKSSLFLSPSPPMSGVLDFLMCGKGFRHVKGRN